MSKKYHFLQFGFFLAVVSIASQTNSAQKFSIDALV